MLVHRLTDWQQFGWIAPQWNALCGDAVFCRTEWLEPWWEHMASPSAELYLLVVLDSDGTLQGGVPWYRESAPARGPRVRFMGSDKACGDYLTLLAMPGKEQAVAEAVADWLELAQYRSDDRFEMLELTGVSAADPKIEALATALKSSGFDLHRQNGNGCWRIPLPTTWDQYLSQVSKPNRRRLRWAERQIEQGVCQSTQVRDAQQWEKAWSLLIDFHQCRREQLGEQGCFGFKGFQPFLCAAAQSLLKSGALRATEVAWEGEPIAVELCIQGASTTFAYQVGINPSALEHSPGWLVNAAAITQAIEQGQAGFDLLRGDEPYKAHLGASTQPGIEWRAVPQRLTSRLRYNAWQTKRAVKRLVKSGLVASHLRSR